MSGGTGGGTSGAVLAGGRSRRLGRDKTILPWPPFAARDDARDDAQDEGAGLPGPTLLEHTAGTLAALCDEVLVAGYRGARPLPPPLRAVPDLFPAGGSLGGIYSALQVAAHDVLLAVATDMPFLSLPLLRWMLAQPRDYDVLLPVREGQGEGEGEGVGAEPLHAVYGKGCLGPMRRRLEGGRLRIRDLFDEVRVREVPAEVLRRLDPRGLSFFNINTPEDLQRAREILSRR
jgi:molybdopterin-guanine dinucleotide biosynthesis protein A